MSGDVTHELAQRRAGDVAGRSVTTIEGLAGPVGEPLHPVQRALVAERASQCGYCTPGIALRAAALLAAHPDPGDDQIAAALNPCLCRCGCYPRITRAVHRAAAMIRGDDGASATGEPQPVRRELARPTTPWDKSMEAGATGLIFGRNVFRRIHDDSLRLVAQLREILAKYPS